MNAVHGWNSASSTPPRPIPGGAGTTACGALAITQSVINTSPAMEAAFCSATRVTLAGSITPSASRSPYSPVAAL